MEAKEGDIVKVITKEEEIEGILMPRPEILDKSFIVVKLDNGYNIGIDKKKIEEIKLIKKHEPKERKKEKIPHNKKLPTITILSTGGTISSRIDYTTGGVCADYTAEDFVEMYPEIAKIANIKAKKIMEIMSEDMGYKEWKKMAEEAAKELKDADGVVITHGTDIMHFTGAALSFFLETGKPVIITGAQRSIDRGSSDAFMNIVCAVTAAARFDGAGVFLCMHGTISDDYCLLHKGTKVRKMHTSRRDAFRTINDKPIAKIFADGKIEVTNNDYKKRGKDEIKLHTDFEEKVALVNVYPGMEPDVLDFYMDDGYKGIVLAATALGHIPVSGKSSLVKKLERAIEKRIPVVISSQTIYGRVHPYVYTNLRKLSIELKCIFVEDMLPETAYIKLGWALANAKKPEEVKGLMLKNIAGELTERSTVDNFLV